MVSCLSLQKLLDDELLPSIPILEKSVLIGSRVVYGVVPEK